MSRKDCEAEPRAPSSQSLLEETPGPLSQQTQATSSRDGERLSSHSLSHGALVALQYLPFFRTDGQLLTEEELAPQYEFCTDQVGSQSIRQELLPEDSPPPSGFFPYYRSKEETFPSLALPGTSCEDSLDPPPRTEEQAGCFCTMMASDSCPAASPGPCHTVGSRHSLACCPSLLASAGHPPESFLDAPVFSDATFMGHALCASGFVPYYRSPEEGLCTSPGMPASPPGLQGPNRGLTGLVQPLCEGIIPATPLFGESTCSEKRSGHCLRAPQAYLHPCYSWLCRSPRELTPAPTDQ